MNNRKAFTLVELMIVLVLVLIVPVVIVGLCVWTDRNLDYLLTWIAGQPRNCPMWLSAIATFVLNGVILVFNIVMEILRLAR